MAASWFVRILFEVCCVLVHTLMAVVDLRLSLTFAHCPLSRPSAAGAVDLEFLPLIRQHVQEFQMPNPR
jgi:hypothetical protein